MHSTESLPGGTSGPARSGTRGSGQAPHRRPRIGTILLVVVVAAAITEPVVMYLKLAHQKEQRREAAELALPVKAERAPTVQ